MPELQKIPVNLQNLYLLAGEKVRVTFDNAVRLVLTDVDDRGDDMKARKVTLTIEVGKISKEQDDVYFDVQVKPSVPAYNTGSTVARLKTSPDRKRVWAEFEPDCPENPHQATLFNRTRHPEAPDQELGGTGPAVGE